MSNFTDFADKPVSTKKTLVEIDIGQTQDVWISYSPGIWLWQNTVGKKGAAFDFGSGAFGYGSFGSSGTDDLGHNAVIYDVSSIIASGTTLTEVSDIATCKSTNNSFYYNQGSTKVYAHFNGYDPPEVFDISLGLTSGFVYGESGYFNDQYYDSKVKSIPDVAKSKDPLFWGVISFEGGTITLDNSDGNFDDFAQKDVYGQQVVIKWGGDELAYADYRTVYTGHIEDFELDFDEFRLKVADDRKKLSKKIPENVYDTTTYPDIKRTNANKPIPILYGVCKNVPVICTNEDEGTPANYEFKICDTTYHGINSIDQVYVEGTAKSHSNENLTNATFTLATADYSPGDDVTADVKGYEDTDLIDDALDVIADLIENHLGTTYNSSNYNTTQWAAEQANVPDIGFFINRRTELYKVIENICQSVYGIFLVQDDGKYTFRTYQSNRDISAQIYNDEWLESPVVTYNNEEYLTSVSVKHSKDWKENEYETYIKDDLETTIYNTYKKYRSKEFETYLTSATDAQTLAETVMDMADEIVPTARGTTKTQYIDLQLEDLINAEMNRVSGELLGNLKWEVIGISKNLTDHTVMLTLRKAGDAVTVYAFGIEGGTAATASYVNAYDNGDATTQPTNIIDGGDATIAYLIDD